MMIVFPARPMMQPLDSACMEVTFVMCRICDFQDVLIAKNTEIRRSKLTMLTMTRLIIIGNCQGNLRGR